MNVEPKSAKGKHCLAAARSSRRATETNLIICCLSCSVLVICPLLAQQWPLPILGWHFGHEGNHYEARHTALATDLLLPLGEHLACWHQYLSLIAVRSPSSVAGVNGDDCRESRPQPIEIRLSRKKQNLDGYSLNDLGEVTSGIVGRQKRELRTAGGRELLDLSMKDPIGEGIDPNVRYVAHSHIG